MRTMKKGLSWLLTLSMILSLFTGLTVGAGAAFDPAKETPEPTAKEAFTFENGKITGYTGSDVNVVIPDAIDGVPVYGIDQAGFMNAGIKTLVIPSTVTSIGQYAFDYNSGLTDVYFYGEVPEFEYDWTAGFFDDWDMYQDLTFHCKKAYVGDFEALPDDENIGYAGTLSIKDDIDADVTDPAYVTNNVYVTVTCGAHGTIEPSGSVPVAKNGSQLFTVTPAENYYLVNEFLVDGVAKELTEVNGKLTYTLEVGEEDHTISVTFVSNDPIIAAQEGFSFETRDDGAWITGYTGDGGDITLPTKYVKDGTTYDVVGVAANAFNTTNSSSTDAKDGEAIAKITKITVPMGIKAIEAGAFSKVGKYTYSGNGYNLEEIVFQDPDTKFVNNSSGQSFQMSGNPKLTKVTLPANLTEITSSMFYGCTALESITIPEKVEKIGARAFEGCTKLKSVTFQSAAAPAMELYGSGSNATYPFKGCNVTLQVPAASEASYKEAWKAMLEAEPSKAGTIKLIAVDEDGNTVVSSISDFKIYDENSDTDYIEYHVTEFDNETHTGEVEVKYVGKNSGSKLKPTGTLTIPSEVETTVEGKDFTFTVVGIGEKAMDYNGYKKSTYISESYWFTTVNFPSTLQYIRKSGCAGLEGVEALDLSNTQVSSIGELAFNNCGSVKTICLPDTLKDLGVPVEIERPNDSGDMNDAKQDVKLDGYDEGENSNIGAGANKPAEAPATGTSNIFRGCQSLEKFVVNDTNEYFKAVDGVLFTKDGSKLIRYPVGKNLRVYQIPEGTEVIAEAAFMQIAGNEAKGNLDKVTFPASLKKIESGAFRQSSLSTVEIKAGVEYGTYVFDCSKSLKTVTVEPGVTTIPDKAFWGCEGLAGVVLADSVKTIGESAFERTGLTIIDLKNVETIGNYAFYGSALTDVTVPAGVKDAGTGAFMNCGNLISARVEGDKLGRYMFWYCTALEKLDAPNVTEIGECALGYCVALKALPLSGVTAIGNGAFRNCRALTTVTLPATLKELGKYAFADCDRLTTVTFADNMGVKILPEGTFYECLGLKDVYLGNSISMTEGMAFYCAGWDNGLKVNVHSDLSENLFFRNEFEACFIDLGSQQTANESADEISYIWTRTETVDGVKTYYFRAKAGGGCGGGCGGGGTESEDGMADFTMSPSVTVIYHWGENSSTENLPKLLTVYEQNGKNAAAKKVDSFNMVDLKDMAAAHAEPAAQSLARGIALFSSEAPTVTTGTVGYQYMGMRGWSIMAATEYVTLDDLGITLKPGDTLKVSASDGASYTVSYEDLMANNKFFPASTSNGTKDADGAQTVPAILALTWNTATIDGSDKTDGEVLSDVAKTAYRSTNFRFAHGLSWEAYTGLKECDSMQPAEGEVCSGYRLLQKVDSITVIHADGSTSGGSVGGGSTSGKTETVTNADGSTTKTETKSDGTVVETTTKPDGSTTIAETKPDGSVSTVEKRADGTEIKTAQPVSGAITASVSVPKSVGSTRVDIPVSKPTSSMVAVIVHPDGTEEIVKGSVVTETGIALRAEGDVQLKIIDNAKRFSDMADHWAKDAVEFASSRELFNGVGNDAFGPDLSMTRGMVNTVLARLAGADTAGGETWYAKGTAWAVENGISDGTNPEQQVTREQLAAMLYRYASSSAVSGELSFDDTAVISVWAYDAVRWCVDNGILNGMGGNRMAPRDLAQRGQVAAMLMRFLQATV